MPRLISFALAMKCTLNKEEKFLWRHVTRQDGFRQEGFVAVWHQTNYPRDKHSRNENGAKPTSNGTDSTNRENNDTRE
ncbi:hypothetical protein OS42_06380 [Dickeya oryzae]